MKNYYALALSTLCGVGIGAVGSRRTSGTAKPPVHMIGNNDVRDGYMKEYLPLVQATLKAHGAVYVAAGKGTASRQRAGSSSFDGIAWSSCLLGGLA